MASKIEDYALVGDCRTAALVGRNGSVDWLCFPRFDSGACFAALLGSNENGCWSLAPRHEVRNVRRAYRGDTLILETEFDTGAGRAKVIDWMTPGSSGPHLFRLVEGIDGEVPMCLELVIRFDYGSIVPWVRRTPRGLRAVAGPDSLYLFTAVGLRGENMHTTAEFVVHAGERVGFELAWRSTYDAPPAESDIEATLRDTEAWWKEWAGRCRYGGEWRDPVMRSMITLKALTYAPTGGIVAAVTTSLPEKIGGVRNWDYRYCWLRDATFALYALINGGYMGEARAWREWLVNAVAGRPDDLNIMYGLSGERRLTELTLDWLPGYENSKPVRIGNAAWQQHQLDVYGEVIDSLHLARRVGLEPSEDAWRIECEMMRFLENDWDQPDEGIWEVRGPRRQFTHSKLMAWVAVDRAVKSVEQFGLKGPVERWRSLATQIRRDIDEQGFDRDLGSYVQYYGSKMIDASLLMMPLVGYLPATDKRIVGTVAAVERYLMREGLVDRYRTSEHIDGLPEGEGAFLACTFWYADNLALQGRYDEARRCFERLLTLRNDVGLLAEEYDLDRRRLIGNFPQAFSHVGLVNTARNLSAAGGPAEDRKKEGRDAAGEGRNAAGVTQPR
ncbi:MAG: glycoside hydrolase family 15 protein [Betaproteobacteria bacterium]|nr:glycoside hydrolase family 15 protein [Betaproteobacteria bacterium]